MSVLLLILELRQILFIRDLTRNLEIENTPVLETGASYGYHVSNEKFVKVNAVDFYVIVTSFRVTESYCYFEAVLFGFQQESQAGYPFLDLGQSFQLKQLMIFLLPFLPSRLVYFWDTSFNKKSLNLWKKLTFYHCK